MTLRHSVFLLALVACKKTPAPAPGPALTPTQERVRDGVRAQASGVKRCFELEFASTPGLQGRVELGWTLEGGRAADVRVRSNDTGSEALATCMAAEVKAWTFDEDLDGDVSWPFVFRPSR